MATTLTAAALTSTPDCQEYVLLDYGRARITARPALSAERDTVTIPLEHGAALALPCDAEVEVAHHEEDSGLVFSAQWVREQAEGMGFDVSAYSDSQVNYAAAQSFLEENNCEVALGDMGYYLEREEPEG